MCPCSLEDLSLSVRGLCVVTSSFWGVREEGMKQVDLSLTYCFKAVALEQEDFPRRWRRAASVGLCVLFSQ